MTKLGEIVNVRYIVGDVDGTIAANRRTFIKESVSQF